MFTFVILLFQKNLPSILSTLEGMFTVVIWENKSNWLAFRLITVFGIDNVLFIIALSSIITISVLSSFNFPNNIPFLNSKWLLSSAIFISFNFEHLLNAVPFIVSNVLGIFITSILEFWNAPESIVLTPFGISIFFKLIHP